MLLTLVVFVDTELPAS